MTVCKQCYYDFYVFNFFLLKLDVKFQCDDETCDYTTWSLNLRVVGESERGTVCPNYLRCNGRLVRQVVFHLKVKNTIFVITLDQKLKI